MCIAKIIGPHSKLYKINIKSPKDFFFLEMLNQYALKFTHEIASPTIGLEMDFLKAEMFFICLICLICQEY